MVKLSRTAPVLSTKRASSRAAAMSITSEPVVVSDVTIAGWLSLPVPVAPDVPTTAYTVPWPASAPVVALAYAPPPPSRPSPELIFIAGGERARHSVVSVEQARSLVRFAVRAEHQVHAPASRIGRMFWRMSDSRPPFTDALSESYEPRV
jgi:hypothetical protein